MESRTLRCRQSRLVHVICDKCGQRREILHKVGRGACYCVDCCPLCKDKPPRSGGLGRGSGGVSLQRGAIDFAVGGGGMASRKRYTAGSLYGGSEWERWRANSSRAAVPTTQAARCLPPPGSWSGDGALADGRM